MLNNRPIRKVAMGVAVAALAGTASVVAATSASASQIGTATAVPAHGNGSTAITLNTSGLCTSGTNLEVFLSGPGFPSNFVAVGNSPQSLYQQGSSYSIPLSQTMSTYAQQAGTTLQTGTYSFTVTCRAKFNGTSLGDFDGSISGTLSGGNWTF